MLPRTAAVLGATVAVSASLSAKAVKPPSALPQFWGVPVAKEDPQEIAMWGEGDSFEDIFESVTVRGSSALPASEGSYYDASRAHDLSLSSAWVEGAKGDGIGEYLEYTLRVTPGSHPADAAITHLIVFNGYRRSRDLWRKNNRVRRLRLTVNGKTYGVVTLADTYSEQDVRLRAIPLPPHAKTLRLRFIVESVYPGTAYHDTALTEMEFGGTGIY